MYRRFDWSDANLAALAEQQCGEPQLKIEQGWQIRYLSCEEVVPAGKAVPASSYDFGYGMKQAAGATGRHPYRAASGSSAAGGAGHPGSQRAGAGSLRAQRRGSLRRAGMAVPAAKLAAIEGAGRDPNERDGRLEQIFFRLQPIAGSQAAKQVSELHVWRQYTWLLEQAKAQQECDEPQTRQEGTRPSATGYAVRPCPPAAKCRWS